MADNDHSVVPEPPGSCFIYSHVAAWEKRLCPAAPSPKPSMSNKHVYRVPTEELALKYKERLGLDGTDEVFQHSPLHTEPGGESFSCSSSSPPGALVDDCASTLTEYRVQSTHM